MKNLIAKMIVLAVLAVALPMVALAQPCTPTFNGAPFTPSTQLNLGQSACIQVCAFTFINFFLVGADLDQAGVPVLTALPGCNPSATPCNFQCDPILPPQLFTLGGSIFFPNPNEWGGNSECLDIVYRWNHDGYWDIEIFPLCDGCFCLSFDDQLAAELSAFDAVAGDNQVNVSWTTESESNMEKFNVLRDGAKVYEVAASNNASGHSYSWVDAGVQNGFSYTYTLEAIDLNGVTEILGATNATPGSANGIVAEFSLAQNFPNPFNPETNISFTLPAASNVTLRVFNLIGQEVATLVDGAQVAGTHVVQFNGANLTSGVYIYRIEAGEFSATRKMILMK